ncbi:MAG TPA: hypothetical protein DDY14_09135 [Chromatiaceae bacterium]|nr:MAG: TerB family tellurite resistance protein [Thiohalocapsa sp. PB-PSB1]HBG95467.1 hypothetical protein [Chromatiaceae bacterium]HCS89680.1 hypothetical protein [Chromatiaceae bacterium]
MLDSIRDFFHEHVLTTPEAGKEDVERALRRAAAALLLEMTHMDNEAQPLERDMVSNLMRECFHLDSVEAERLLACAEAEREESTDYFQFTYLINEHFDLVQKERLIEAMWRVAYADHRLSKYEEYLVRKISDLLYVPHAFLLEAKYRVQLEMGLSQG